MSGQISSPWLSQNELYYPRFANQQLAEGEQKYTQNQLATQQAQQTIGANETQAVARAAGALYSMSEDQAAAAYPGMLATLRGQGYKLANAPASYPGHAAIGALLQGGMSPTEQISSGMIMPPGLQTDLARTDRLLTPRAGGGAGDIGGKPLAPVDTGTIEPEAQTRAFAVRDGLIKRGLDPETATAFAANALHESGAKPGTGAGDAGASHGLFQWRDDRYNNYVKTYGHAPDNAPLDEQLDFVMRELGGPEGVAKSRILGAKGVAEKAGQVSEAYLRPKDTVAEMNRRAGTALKLAGLNAPPGPDAQAGMTDQAWLDQQAKTYPSLAGPNVNQQAGTQPSEAPGGPPTPAPYQVASLTPTPPPGPTAPAAATPDVAPPQPQPQAQVQLQPPAPAPAPPPPAAQPTATGVNSPQFQEAAQLQAAAADLLAKYPTNPAAKARAAALQQRATLLLQADSVTYDASGIGTKAISGERVNAAQPLPQYEWDPQRGAYVDKTGTHPPVTPPSPRMTVTPAGDVVQARPGGGINVVAPADTAGIAARQAAEQQGSKTGAAVAATVPQLATQGRDAGQSIANIDYGMNQLREAAKGGIPTGYFSQWLATGAAAAKSLGIDLSALGIDPKAVGNIQSAQKTLGVVAGAILQQAIGKGGQITDAKIDHFIHTQPGIETDPNAIERVLNWARSQFVYEHNMARDAMGVAAQSPGGMLPLNWQAQYYATHGFAPIYNPGSGEMEQPGGRSPSDQPVITAPVNPAAREAGRTYDTPKGPLKWNGTGWVKP